MIAGTPPGLCTAVGRKVAKAVWFHLTCRGVTAWPMALPPGDPAYDAPASGPARATVLTFLRSASSGTGLTGWDIARDACAGGLRPVAVAAAAQYRCPLVTC
ncbi:hypothetical protein [Streptomyces sp. NPDC002133]|uniref:hypothetical protein n=1 Tax=Streptomyces sp. NPDC002133 TaxID=3154409 RepID=UPI003319B520